MEEELDGGGGGGINKQRLDYNRTGSFYPRETRLMCMISYYQVYVIFGLQPLSYLKTCHVKKKNQIMCVIFNRDYYLWPII